jgi:hypothetical protein
VIQCLISSAVTSLGSPAKPVQASQQGRSQRLGQRVQELGRDGETRRALLLFPVGSRSIGLAGTAADLEIGMDGDRNAGAGVRQRMLWRRARAYETSLNPADSPYPRSAHFAGSFDQEQDGRPTCRRTALPLALPFAQLF